MAEHEGICLLRAGRTDPLQPVGDDADAGEAADIIARCYTCPGALRSLLRAVKCLLLTSPPRKSTGLLKQF